MRHDLEWLGLSFDLPEGWQKRSSAFLEEHTYFIGPNARPNQGTDSIEVIKFSAKVLEDPAYYNWENRRAFFMEGEGEDASVTEFPVRGEANAMLFRKTETAQPELSIVRDGVHYLFQCTNDEATASAIRYLCESVSFPSPEKAMQLSDPQNLGLARAIQKLKEGSPDVARGELTGGGWTELPAPTGTFHVRSQDQPSRSQAKGQSGGNSGGSKT